MVRWRDDATILRGATEWCCRYYPHAVDTPIVDFVVALLEEAFGTSDSDPSQGADAVAVERRADGELTVETVLFSDEIDLILEISNDLVNWQGADDGLFALSREAGEGGGDRLRWTMMDEAVEGRTFRALRIRATR